MKDIPLHFLREEDKEQYILNLMKENDRLRKALEIIKEEDFVDCSDCIACQTESNNYDGNLCHYHIADKALYQED
jgi:uncharacterized protein YdhG (YjbR/CyaY superfamily)